MTEQTEKVENETSAKISNEDLLEDIAITGRELEAYQKLVEGFTVLESLPDQTAEGRAKYRTQHMIYSSFESRCAEFLRALHKLKAERGL